MSKTVIDIPKDIKRRSGSDTVSYQVRNDGKNKTSHSAACYASHMGQLSVIEMWCHRDKKSAYGSVSDGELPGELFVKWMHVLKEHRLAPVDCEASFDKDGNHLYIPRGYSKHQVYSALCGYRWAESIAPMPYTVLKLIETRPQISFWQILHYALANYVVAYGHSWTHLIQTPAGSYCSQNNGQSMNLASSLAFPFFWNRMRRNRTEKQTKQAALYNAGYTCDAVGKIATELAPPEKMMAGKRNVNMHPFLIDGNSDSILDPKWTILYAYAESASQAPDLSVATVGADLKRLYDLIVKDDKKEQEFREKIIKSLSR